MLVALFIGDHSQDALNVRLGCWLTRQVQKGKYGVVTHCEAILHAYPGGIADIASSSVRDGGVRIKEREQLDPANWWIVDVPQWDVEQARAWFAANLGAPYDWRGAWAAVMPGHHRDGEFFCNEAVGYSVGLLEAFTFTPSQFAAICFTLGRDVTAQFFQKPAPEEGP